MMNYFPGVSLRVVLASHSVPPNTAQLVARNHPLPYGGCLAECSRIYDQCKRVTPECVAHDQLMASLIG